ncbi:hypothetical protein [Nonomuraea indica]|uniref:hypothetical protein n=1 Tax=Nonomuraea indica TaxID=1581193 RepID=UPI000C7E0A1D|nr:hypothetical protein [Nonomuraea indica]
MSREDLRHRYAAAIDSVLDKPNGHAYRGTLPDAVLAVRDDELATLRARAERAEAAIARIRSYIDEDFRFWCSPFSVASQYAQRLLDFIDRAAR